MCLYDEERETVWCIRFNGVARLVKNNATTHQKEEEEETGPFRLYLVVLHRRWPSNKLFFALLSLDYGIYKRPPLSLSPALSFYFLSTGIVIVDDNNVVPSSRGKSARK